MPQFSGRSIDQSRVGCEYQWRIVGDDRAVLQVSFVSVHVIGAPLETATGKRTQISCQPSLSCHEV